MNFWLRLLKFGEGHSKDSILHLRYHCLHIGVLRELESMQEVAMRPLYTMPCINLLDFFFLPLPSLWSPASSFPSSNCTLTSSFFRRSALKMCASESFTPINCVLATEWAPCAKRCDGELPSRSSSGSHTVANAQGLITSLLPQPPAKQCHRHVCKLPLSMKSWLLLRLEFNQSIPSRTYLKLLTMRIKLSPTWSRHLGHWTRALRERNV